MIIMIFVFILFLVTRNKIKDKISKLFIWTFFLPWTLQSVLSQFGIYDLFVPKDQTIMYVAVHMLSFYWGFMFVKMHNYSVKSIANKSFLTIKNDVIKISQNKIYVTILLIVFIYTITIFLKFINVVLMMQNITDARIEGVHEIYGNTYRILNIFFLSPFSVITQFLFAYKTYKKRDWIWLVMGLFLIFRCSMNGGRVGYFYLFLVVVFVGFLLQNKPVKNKSLFSGKSFYLTVCIVGVLMYFIIGLVTAGRNGDLSMDAQAFNDNQETTNKHFYTYAVAPVVAFDYGLNHDFVEKQGGYHYGALTLCGIDEVQYIVANKLGFSYNRPIAQYTKLIQDDYYFLGAMNWNALYTWCNFFYYDLGVIGLIIFPFIFGLLTRKIIKYFYSNPNVYSASLLLYFYINISMSFIKYSFDSIIAILIICTLFYLSEKSKKKALLTNI